MIHYEHTQKGGLAFWMSLVGTFMVMGACIWPLPLLDLSQRGDAMFFCFMAFVGVIVGLLMIWSTFLMKSLTIRIDQDLVYIIFGPGCFRKRIGLDQVTSVRPVKNSVWMGWGIRYIFSGWLYNISGLDAVELRLEDGRTIRIGTDEPEVLNQAIHQRISIP